MISAEILYRFFILKTYLKDMSENQTGAIRGHYQKKMKWNPVLNGAQPGTFSTFSEMKYMLKYESDHREVNSCR